MPAIILDEHCYKDMYRNCYSLTGSSELPAKYIPKYAYYRMFENCRSLVNTGNISGEFFDNYACQEMYENCSGLINPPELCMSGVSKYSFNRTFYNCKKLVKSPKLEATIVNDYCFEKMFYNCYSLTGSYDDYNFILPSMNLSNSCYKYMFYNCSSLINAPELPALSLSNYCYNYMFYNCKSLKDAPKLPATKLINYCYRNMFEKCSSLSSLNVRFTKWNNSYTKNWVKEISDDGEFKKPKELPEIYDYSKVPPGWNDQYLSTPLTFIPIGNINVSSQLWITGSSSVSGLQYRTLVDDENNVDESLIDLNQIENDEKWSDWISYKCGSGKNSKIIFDKNTKIKKIQFQNKFQKFSNYNSNIRFYMLGQFEVSGNIQSLLNYTDSCYDKCYRYLFYNCSGLINASGLTLNATHVASYCYESMFERCRNLKTPPVISSEQTSPYFAKQMFYNCSSLIVAPKLPAKELEKYCYQNMFYNCSSLLDTPELPAHKLADYCYYGMFKNCKNLSGVSELPAKILKPSCYREMFYNCTSIKEVNYDLLPAKIMKSYSYYQMFRGCKSLIKAPELMAKDLDHYCYAYMFYGCSNLNYLKIGFKSWNQYRYRYRRRRYRYYYWWGWGWRRYYYNSSINNSTYNWLGGVSPSGVIVKSSSLLNNWGSNFIPNKSDWEIQYLDEPLTLIAEEDNVSIKIESHHALRLLYRKSENIHDTSQWSLDRYYYRGYRWRWWRHGYYYWRYYWWDYRNGEGWIHYNASYHNMPRSGTIITLNKGEGVQFQNVYDNPDDAIISTSSNKYTQFKISGMVTASGNVQSLLNYNEECNDYCFYKLFKGCSGLLTAPELPAINLAPNCYESMFEDCVSLSGAPNLPATFLENECYKNMFKNCNNLNSLTANFIYWDKNNSESYDDLSKEDKLDILERFGRYTRKNTHRNSYWYYNYSYYNHWYYYNRYYYRNNWYNYNLVKNSSEIKVIWNNNIATKRETKVTGRSYFYIYVEHNDYIYDIGSKESIDFINQYLNSLSINESLNWLHNSSITGNFIKPKPLDIMTGSSYIPSSWISENINDYPLTFYANKSNSSITLEHIILDDIDNIKNIEVKISFNTNNELLGNIFKEKTKFISFTFLLKTIDEITNELLLPNYFTEEMEFEYDEFEDIMYDEDYKIYSFITSNSLLIETFKLNFIKCVVKIGNIEDDEYIDVNDPDNMENINILTFSKDDFIDLDFIENPRLFDDNIIDLVPELSESVEDDDEEETIDDIDMFVEDERFKDDEIEYRLGTNQEWTSYPIGFKINLENKGDIVQFRNLKTKFSKSPLNFFQFLMEGEIISYGNVQSLISKIDYSIIKDSINEDNSLPDKLEVSDTCHEYGFYKLFENCESLIRAPEMPAKILEKDCYTGMYLNCKNLQYSEDISGDQLSGIECCTNMYYNCTNLTKAPELPALKLTNSCYKNMFYNCESLEYPPKLPAISLANSCYEDMFNGCKSLKIAPTLPALELTDLCYKNMFNMCESLEYPPDLLSISLGKNCYENMFSNTGLKKAPELPALDLTDSCYKNMFRNCKYLEDPPSGLPSINLTESCYDNMFNGCLKLVIKETLVSSYLPATDLKLNCYNSMFENCKSLIDAPEFKIDVQFKPNCLNNMFLNCTSLSYIKCLPFEIGENLTTNWVENVAKEGRFIKNESMISIFDSSNIPVNWDVELDILPITFIPENKNGGELSISIIGSPDVDIQYRILPVDNLDEDVKDWIDYKNNEIITCSSSSSGIQFKNTKNTLSISELEYVHFNIHDSFKITGDLRTLLNYKDQYSNYCFYRLFYNCDGLVNTPELISEHLTNWCYKEMFNGCSNITKAPLLLSLDMRIGCYEGMFMNCSNLKMTPELPSISLAQDCYKEMFKNCVSLTGACELIASKMFHSSYAYMFENCEKLSKCPELPATSLDRYCYQGMFKGCNSLKDESSLPSLTELNLAVGCYANMFENCENLVKVPELPATILTDECYKEMFKNCGQLTNAALYGENVMNKSYDEIFSGCSALDHIDVNFTDWDYANLATSNWTKDVSTTGIFVKFEKLEEKINSNVSSVIKPGINPVISSRHVYDYIPSGWIIKNKDTNLYLTLIAKEPNTTIKLIKHGNPIVSGLQYRYGTSGKWEDYIIDDVLTLSDENDEIQFQNTEELLSISTEDYVQFNINGSVDATGNMQSMLHHINDCKDYCFYKLFKDCEGLYSMPLLLSLDLATSCYEKMFEGCINLLETTELPALRIANNCYEYMFNGCSSLSAVTIRFIDWTFNDSENNIFTKNWLSGVSSSGIFKKSSILNNKLITYDESHVPENWKVENINDPLTFVSEFDNVKISLNRYCDPTVNGLLYRFGFNSKWEKYEINSILTLEKKYDILQFKNTENTLSLDDLNYVQFKILSKVKAWGNMSSMLNDSTYCNNYCFKNLFYNCSNLLRAPELPMMDLAENCYFQMFYGCDNLEEGPELPAKVLEDYCYAYMFRNCTNLKYMPDLNAEILGNGCCYQMFYGCSSLSGMTKLKPLTLTNLCYAKMFEGCEKLTMAPNISAIIISENSCNGMFKNCINLVNPPELQAIEIKEGGYEEMFKGCTSLIEAPELLITELDKECYKEMFKNCSSLTGMINLPANSLSISCYESMFEGCTSLIKAPELPATILNDECYQYMFKGCTSLIEAPELPATITYKSCYQGMFRDCINLTKAPELPALKIESFCYFEMFLNCKNLKNAQSKLPGIKLSNSCYSHMFEGCEHLEIAPILPAFNLTNGCYYYMFNGCKRLTKIEVGFYDWNDENSTFNWVKGIEYDKKCEFISSNYLMKKYGDSYIPTNWKFSNYKNFMFYAKTKSSNIILHSINLNESNESKLPKLLYKVNGENWKDYEYNSIINTTINDCVEFKYNNDIIQDIKFSKENYMQFELNGEFVIDGYVNNLINSNVGESYKCVDYCFYRLFKDCKGLLIAPLLPLNKLAKGCYEEMFDGCINLSIAPDLPATELAIDCYKGMFRGCKNLNSSIELPAVELKNGCYVDMFNGCSKLNNLKVKFLNWEENATSNWLKNVENNGAFKKQMRLETIYGDSYIPQNWVITTNPFTIISLRQNSKISLDVVGNPEIPKLQYRLNEADEWIDYDINKIINLEKINDFIQFQNKSNNLSIDEKNYFRFNLNGRFNCEGNIQSLLNYSDKCDNFSFYKLFNNNISLESILYLPAKIVGYKTYYKMFEGCKNLKICPELPATVLSISCYESMFEGCESISITPELPATTLMIDCYKNMFKNCKNLVLSKKLPANVLAIGCYESMFEGCEKLTIINGGLLATTLANNCYKNMFAECTSLNIAPKLLATTLANNCYEGMFYNCSSLIKMPELPAKELYDYCYYNMFNGCINLKQVSKLPATTLTRSCYESMFYNCSSLIDAPELPAMNLSNRCYSFMFGKCTNLIKAPDLLATNLVNNCYLFMFEECTNLKYIKVGFTQWLSSTENWMTHISSSGTFIKPLALPEKYGNSYIPINDDNKWIIENY